MNNVTLPLSCVVNGRTWNLFSAEYTTPDGKFSFYFHALSWEHAAMILADIKENATLSGQIDEVIDAGGKA